MARARRTERARRAMSARSTSASSGPQSVRHPASLPGRARAAPSVRSTGSAADDVAVAALDGVGAEQRVEDRGLGRLDDRAEERVEELVVDDLDGPQRAAARRAGSAGRSRTPGRSRPSRGRRSSRSGRDPCRRGGPAASAPAPAAARRSRRRRRSCPARDRAESRPASRPRASASPTRTPSIVSRAMRPKFARTMTPTVYAGGPPASSVASSMPCERPSVDGVDDARRRADAALHLEADHPGPGADGAARRRGRAPVPPRRPARLRRRPRRPGRGATR